MRLDFAAQVTEHGMLLPDDAAAWRAGVGRFRGKRLVVSIESVTVTRSSQQNRRYWSLLAPVAAEVLSVGRAVPLSKDDAHYILKWAFIGHEDTPLGPVPKHSKTLSTAEFCTFCDKVEAWLSQEHGVCLPALGESVEVSL